MALTLSNLSPNISSGLVPGLGFAAIIKIAWDNSYDGGIAGEALDLSGTFPTEVFGGVPINETVGDGGYKVVYVRDATGTPTGGLLQCYGVISNNLTESGPLLLMATGHDVSAMNGQHWLFFGR